MMTAMSIKEAVKANGMRFKDRHAQVVEKFQSGLADGVADQMNIGLAIAHNDYFVDTYRQSGKAAVKPNIQGRSVNYVEIPGANKADKRGKMKFVKGKIVNRTGQMAQAISPVTWAEHGGMLLGKNKSSDMLVRIERKPDEIHATIEVSGRTGKLMGIHINKSKIRILMLAFRTAGANFRKLADAGIMKKILPLKVVRK